MVSQGIRSPVSGPAFCKRGASYPSCRPRCPGSMRCRTCRFRWHHKQGCCQHGTGSLRRKAETAFPCPGSVLQCIQYRGMLLVDASSLHWRPAACIVNPTERMKFVNCELEALVKRHAGVLRNRGLSEDDASKVVQLQFHEFTKGRLVKHCLHLQVKRNRLHP